MALADRRQQLRNHPGVSDDACVRRQVPAIREIRYGETCVIHTLISKLPRRLPVYISTYKVGVD